MTDVISHRVRPRRRPAPRQAEGKLGWGAWVLVGLCVILGAVLLFALQARTPRTVPAVPEARTTPPPIQAPAQPAGPAAAPTASPTSGEGLVTRSPEEGLRVLWAKPQGLVPMFPNTTIEVRFSTPMDRASVQENFKISPPVPGAFEWPRPDQIEFRPRPNLEMGAEYKVSLSEVARDSGRMASLTPFAWTFTVHKAYTFRQNVGRVIRHGCGTCHRPEGEARRVPLGSYPEVLRYVQRGNAAGSPLYAALRDQRTHGGIPLDWKAMSYVIRDWIDKFDAAE